MIHACLCQCQVAGYKIPRRSSSWLRPLDPLLPIASKGLWKFPRQKPFELFEVKVFLFIQLSSHIKWFTVDKKEKVKVRKFVNVQQGHEYSRFFGLYVKVFQMWTSRQRNEVLNIVQTKKYSFWGVFIDQRWLKFRIFDHISTACVIDNTDNVCVKSAEGYNLLGAFESALYRSNHLVVIFKRNLTIIILIRTRSGE